MARKKSGLMITLTIQGTKNETPLENVVLAFSPVSFPFL